MQVLCVHEFLTVLEAWVPRGDLYNKNREMRFYVAHSALVSTFRFSSSAFFSTSHSEPAGQEANAD